MNSFARAPLVLLAAALALHLSACGDEAGDTHADTHTHESESETDADTGTETGEELQTDTYVDGLSKDTENGMYTVKLTSDPGPPALGDNMWMLGITSDGAPVVGASVKVEPWMPQHGHGPNTPATVSEVSDGMYHAHPLDLFMAGVWDTTVTVETTAGSDTVHFVFEIAEGEGGTDTGHDHG